MAIEIQRYAFVRLQDGVGVKLDRDKVMEYSELYQRLGSYPYDQDPLRPGWTPTIPNDRWANPLDARVPEIPF
jgi:glucarate dehydratase